MAGALGPLNLMPPEDIGRIDSALSTSVQSALEELQKRGLTAARPPENFHGEMPNDLTSLDDEGIGDLLNNLSRYTGYLDTQLSIANAYLRQAEEHVKKSRARIRLTFKVDEEGKKLAVPDKDDRVEADPRIVEATRREIYYFTFYTVLKSMRDEAQRNWETVSRRITQRGQEVGRIRREGNVAGAPLQGRTFVRRTQQ